MPDSVALIVGLVLTLFIYSYLVGDNPLYRIAVHLLVGVSAGYAGVVAIRHILLPAISQLLADPVTPEAGLWLVPLSLSLLLLFKWTNSLSWVGNTSLGILVTIGAAVALFGAIAGTVIPQVTAFQAASPILSLLVALLTACALIYFQFTGRPDPDAAGLGRNAWHRPFAVVGQFVLMVAFGAIFAGVFTTSLVLLVERVDFFLTGLSSLLGIILL